MCETGSLRPELSKVSACQYVISWMSAGLSEIRVAWLSSLPTCFEIAARLVPRTNFRYLERSWPDITGVASRTRPSEIIDLRIIFIRASPSHDYLAGTQSQVIRISIAISSRILFSIRFSANSCRVPQSDGGRIPELLLFHP